MAARIYDPFAADYQPPEETGAPGLSLGAPAATPTAPAATATAPKIYDPFAADYEAPAPAQGVVLPSIKRAAGQMVESAGTTIEDVTGPNVVTQGLRDFGGGVVRDNPSQIQSFGDVLDKPWTTVKEAVAEQVPQLGAAFAGARLGATAGAMFGPAGAAVGGVVGGLAPIFVGEYGEIRNKQEETGEENIPLALAGAGGATALERLGLEKFATKAGTKGVAEALGKVPEGSSRLAHAGTQALKTALVEGPGTEIPQTAIERFAGGQELGTPEAFDEYGVAGAKGFAGGGAIGGGLGLVAPREQAGTPATAPGVAQQGEVGAGGSPPPNPPPSQGGGLTSSSPPSEGGVGGGPDVGLADLDPEQQRHMMAIRGQGLSGAASGLPAPANGSPPAEPSRRSRGPLSPLGVQQAERARADIAAEQVRMAELAARGPLSRAVAFVGPDVLAAAAAPALGEAGGAAVVDSGTPIGERQPEKALSDETQQPSVPNGLSVSGPGAELLSARFAPAPQDGVDREGQATRHDEGYPKPGQQAQDVIGGLAIGHGAVASSPSVAVSPASVIDEAAHQAATSPQNDLPQPTEPQKQAGNFQKGHVRYAGLDISIENPKGSKRSGVDPEGRPWEIEMGAHYGYVRRTEGKDGEQVDVYLASEREDTPAFVVDQVDPKTGRFDEHKVVLGAASREEAEQLYDAHFSDGSGVTRRQAVSELPMEGFKTWLKQGDTKQPIAGQKLALTAPAVPAAPPTPTDIPTLPAGASPGASQEAAFSPEAHWDGLAPEERLALGQRAGWAKPFAQGFAKQRWAKLSPAARNVIARNLTPDAPAAAEMAPGERKKAVSLGRSASKDIDITDLSVRADTNAQSLGTRLRDPDMQAALRHMATQAGWAQRGGEMLRDAQDQVTGRTTWLPNEPWYAAIPERLDREATAKAVKKAIAGKKLGGKEERVLGYMLDAFEREREEGQVSPEDREGQSAQRPEEDEAEREAREEREGIMAEAELALDALSDADINALISGDWTPFDGQVRLRDDEIRRFFDGDTAQRGRGAEQADSRRQVGAATEAGPKARVDGEGNPHPPSPARSRGGDQRPLLEGYSAADLGEREQARLGAERKEAEETAAAQRKRQADRDREGFVLTGSDNVADELEARGQGSLLDQPAAEAPPIKQASSKQPAETAGDGSQVAPQSQEGDQTRSAVDWASEMARLREIKPRPIAKLYGAKGPTEEQRIAHADALRKWEKEYRKASKAQKEALARDNAEFWAARAAPPTRAAAPEGGLPNFKTGKELDTWLASNVDDPYQLADETHGGWKAKLVDAQLAKDSAALEEERNRPGRIEHMVVEKAKRELAAGRIDQDAYNRVVEKYGAAASQYTSQNPAAKEKASKPTTSEEPIAKPAEPEAQKAETKEKPAKPIEDVGEKIGGARKDLWRERGLRLADLEGMSGGEEAQYVTKENVWPAIDYPKLIADGATPQAAALIKIVRDRLAKTPNKDTPEGRRHYVEMIGIAREELEKAKTAEEVKAVGNAVFTRIGWYNEGGRNWRSDEVRAKAFSVYQGRSNPFSVEWKDTRKADKMIAEGWPATKKAKTKTQAAREEGKLPERPHLDQIERTGEDRRQGRDVTGENFLKEFGFRGVEHGLWAAQDERQKALNLAYEALHDLAGTLGIPPKALSLNGTLGLAFGARGSGQFAAHYEPGKLVINLTKLRGAGTLAHEWGHGLDHYFGELDRPDAYQGGARGATGWMGKGRRLKRENLRPEMAAAFDGVMKAIFERETDKAEAVRATELRLETMQAEVANGERRLAKAEQAEHPDKDWLKRMRAWLDDAHRSETNAKATLAELRNEPRRIGGYGKIASSYFKEASKLAGTGDYWTRPTELFARAFEAYVFDRIGEQGQVSQYLVQGVEPERYGSSAYKGNPYPVGLERDAINAAFDKLFAAMQTRETEKGTALYSYLGREAALADHSALGEAIALRNKVPMEEIRERTGWFRAKDGQWRFEISDKDSRLKEGWENQKSRASLTIGDVFDHPKLFENYPALADIGLQFDDLPPGADGSFNSSAKPFGRPNDPAVGRITLAKRLDSKAARSVLLHEIQHVVQTIERFAKGGNTRSASIQKAALERYSQEYEALAKRLDKIQTLREDWIRKHESDYPRGRPQVTAAHDARFPQVAKEIRRMRERIGALGHTTRFKAYQRLLGEVEARDVQARRDMTDEERRGSAPYVSQGIKEEDFLIDFTGEAAALEGPPGGTHRGVPLLTNQKPGPAGLSASGVRETLAGRFGAGVGRLIEAKTLRIVQHEAELPARLNDGKGGIRGVYDPKTDTTWMVGDNLTAADAPGVFLHELGVHLGLERMVGSDKYQDIIRQMKAMEGLGNEALRAARAAIPNSTPKAAVDDELIAYLVEKHPELPIVKRIIAAIRAFLFRHGLIKNVRPEDVVALAKAAAKHAARGVVVDRREKTAQRRYQDFSPAYSGAPLWYSEMARFLDDKAPGKAPAAQWKGLLEGWAKQGKFKGDELEWSGVKEWLEIQEGAVTKDQVLGFVRENGVRVEETTLGGGLTAQERAELEESPRLYDLEDAEKARAAKFAQWQLPGGENYREVLLRLPAGEVPKVAKHPELDGKYALQYADGSYVRNPPDSASPGAIRAWDSAQLANDHGLRAWPRNAQFASSHFDEPNILAHVRFNERTDADGKRVLFIEEIQSDWAQKGKKEGFKSPTKHKELEAAKARVDTALEAFHRIKRKQAQLTGLANPTAPVYSWRADWELRHEYEAVESTLREADRAYRALGAINEFSDVSDVGVPPAPFVGKTEAWVALALKRMIRHAAENGFERIAWTNGEQQAERYDLSKQLDTMQVKKAASDEGYVIVGVKGGQNVFGSGTVPREKLADYIGKDLADKALTDLDAKEKQQGAQEYHGVTYSGLDLKVGGSGMRAFYDKIVPNVANGLLKKLGGGRVQTLTLKLDNAPESVVADVARREPDHPFVKKNRSVQPGFDITPELRASAMRGLPLFSRVQVSGDVFGPYSDLDDLRRKARDYAQREYVGRPKVETVRATNEQVIIPWQGVKHSIATAFDDATLKTVVALPEIIRNARYLATEEDRELRPNIKAIHHYEANAAMGGKNYRILLVIREHLDGKRFYDHFAVEETKEPAGSGEHQAQRPDESLQPAAGSETTIGAPGGPVKGPQAPIYYSRAPEGPAPDPNTPEGSAAALGRIGEAMRTTRHGWEAVKSKLIEDWRPARLALATRRQLVDIGQGMVPELADYDRAVQAMDADRNQLDGETHEVAEIAEAYVQANPKEADDFFDLLHAATLAGVDPADKFRASINRNEAFAEMASLRRRMRTRPGEADVLQGQIDEIQLRLGNEKVRKSAHPGLARRWFRLSQDAKVVYSKMRDLYKKRFDEREAALIQRIRDTEADERWKARLIADIKHRFETARLSAPYFPLTRFGDFWVAAVNPDGEREFHLRESAHQMKALTEDLERAGYHDIASGRKIDTLFEQQGASAEFVTEVIKLLDRGTHISHAARADLKDAIYQVYLQSLPELSTRRHWIHRKKTPGFSQDAVRGFAKHMFHGNRQLAVLRQQTPMEKALANARKREKFGFDPAHEPMEQALRDMRKVKKDKTDPDLVALEKALADARKSVKERLDPVRTADLINEMQKRDKWIKNPQVASWAFRAGSLGFLWYLTAPASAIVNVTQTPLVAYPLLAAHHGWGKSAKALNAAMVDFFKGRFSVEGALQGEELAAYKRFLADAVIDKTQTHDLAGMAETPSGSYSGRGAKAMRYASFMFHRAEMMNREITALAAFRLARADGLAIEAAYQQAKTLTFEAHFDYSTGNKPRFLQNDAARVLFMFKQFSQHMLYLLGRSAHQSVKGLSPAARSEARTRLTGLLGMHALFAGALGMPLMSTLAFVMNALFDDEDEPWDFETELRNFFADVFGPEIGQAIVRGPVESLTGLGIASRVGLSDLLFREPDKSLEGRGLVEWWSEQLLGPLGGIALKAGTAYDMFQDGETRRALESMTPTAIRSGLQSLRYYQEGAQSLRGDPVMEDVSMWNLVGQFAGFSPAELGQKYDANRALKDLEQRIIDRRERLINRWWLARRHGDLEGVQEAMAEIGRFNASSPIQQNPRARITPATLLASMQKRRDYSRRAEGGIIVDPRLSRLEERVRFGE